MSDSIGILLSAFVGLVPLAVIVAIVLAIVRGRRDEEEDLEPGIGTVRRLFLYGGMAVALGFAAWGVGTLLRGALDLSRGEAIVGDREAGLALGLSFTIVGTPAWLLFALGAARAVRSHAVERASILRRLYLGLARAVPLVVFAFTATDVGVSLVHGERPAHAAVAAALVAAGVWALHALAASREPPPTPRTRFVEALEVYFSAALGLAFVAVGAGEVTRTALGVVYDDLFRGGAFVQPSVGRALLEPLVLAIVGAPIWAWHWFDRARREFTGGLVVVYLLAGVLAGLSVALTAAGTIVYSVLEWFLGSPEASTAVRHFDILPGAFAALLTGGALWGYHRTVLRERRSGLERGEPERTHGYVLAGAGLVVLAAALTRIFAVALDSVSTESSLVRPDGWWRNPLILGVTLLIIGAPLWGRSWSEVQRHASEAPERASPARRIYLFAIFGVAVLVALIDLTIVLFQFFDGWLEGTLSIGVVRETRWSIALLLTAGATSVYHWLVLREDRAYGAASAQAAPRVREIVLVVPDGAEALGERLERRLGVRVRTWRRLDVGAGPVTTVSEERLAALVEELRDGPSERVEVVVDGRGELTVIPFRAQ